MKFLEQNTLLLIYNKQQPPVPCVPILALVVMWWEPDRLKVYILDEESWRNECEFLYMLYSSPHDRVTFET